MADAFLALRLTATFLYCLLGTVFNIMTTVAELIEKLKKENQNAIVLVDGYEYHKTSSKIDNIFELLMNYLSFL